MEVSSACRGDISLMDIRACRSSLSKKKRGRRKKEKRKEKNKNHSNTLSRQKSRQHLSDTRINPNKRRSYIYLSLIYLSLICLFICLSLSICSVGVCTPHVFYLFGDRTANWRFPVKEKMRRKIRRDSPVDEKI